MDIAVSSWALHRTLGVSYPDSPGAGIQGANHHQPHELPLLELPAALKAHGFDRMELCHFHLPSRDPGYLSEFRGALAASGVVLQSLLIDEGDISDPEHGARDADWIGDWIEIAGELGAQRARAIAGKQPYSPENLERSAHHLASLAQTAIDCSLRLSIENWFALLPSPGPLLELLDRLEGHVALCADFGNWDRSHKYEDLPLIMPRAETCHSKCEFNAAMEIDMEDYGRCLKIARDAGYTGPHVLVNGGPGDEWAAVEINRRALTEFYAVGV